MLRHLMMILVQVAVWLSFISPDALGRDEPKSTESSADDTTAVAVADAKIRKINDDLQGSLQAERRALPVIAEQEPGAVDKYSRRGDLQFFLGDFDKAEADYRQMVTLQPDLDASHWRLGIAMYFAGHPEQAAAQFDKYHSFDNVDRENGIWRYLSHRKAFGKEKAREQLLKYEKDDRPPFKEVYRLFDGSLSGDDVLKSVPSDLPQTARDSRLFYAQLYIGMNCSAEGENDRAVSALRLATLNSWPQQAGYGPRYMWHVGRLQYSRLKAMPDTNISPDPRK